MEERIIATKDMEDLSRFIKQHEEKLQRMLSARYAQIKKKVEEMPYSQLHGICCLELRQGIAHLEMEASEKFKNWNGVLCGGAVSTLIDISIGAAFETLIDFGEEMVATISLQTDYLAPAQIGKILCAKASWSEVKSINGDEVPTIKVPPGNKKVARATATVIQKPEDIKIAEGTSWYVIYGKKPRK